MLFSQLSLSPVILRALTEEGYETPTPIQAKAIPHIIAGRDVLGCAQTGTGKTAAFALPILHRLISVPRAEKPASSRGPAPARVLVLSPTRELAQQIADSFATYGRGTGLRSTVIYGGVSQMRQVRDLQRGVDVIIATPGRLMDLMEQRLVTLAGIEMFVLDEADRMLDMGFIQPIRRIAAATPAARQTLLFSATMPEPIVVLSRTLLRDPVRVEVDRVASAAPKIEQTLYHVRRPEKQALLTHLLSDPKATRVVVFTKTKHGADRVGERLGRAGIHAETIHGNKAQNARTRALDKFRSGQSRVLVATDVAARGLDVDLITHVVNYDLPMEPEAYVHRIGRTGRAGATGTAVSFCDAEERGLLRDIERLLGSKIPTLALPALTEITRPDAADAPPRPAHSSARSGRSMGAPSATAQGPAKPAHRQGAAAPHHGSAGPGRAPHHAPAPHAPAKHATRPASPSGPGHARASGPGPHALNGSGPSRGGHAVRPARGVNRRTGRR